MATKQQDIDAFISLMMEGESLPITKDENQVNKNVWSGRIAEVTEETFGWFMFDNAGPPKFDGHLPNRSYWFMFSDCGSPSQPGILFWQRRHRCFGRRLDWEEWELFLEVAELEELLYW